MIGLAFLPAWTNRARLLSMASGVAALFAMAGHADAQTCAADCDELTPQCVELLAGIAPAAGPTSPMSNGSHAAGDHGNSHARPQGNGGDAGNGTGGGDDNGDGGGDDHGNGGGDQGNGGGGDQGNGGEGGQSDGGGGIRRGT